MEETRCLTFQVMPGPADEPSSLRFSQAGKPWGQSLPGSLLKRAFRLKDGRFLLFVTDDTPYEDTLRIYLLSTQGNLLDRLEFGAAYVTGVLEDIEVLDETTITFEFVHRKRCTITVLDKPRWRWGLLLMPGVRGSPLIGLRGLLAVRFLGS